MVRNFGEKRRRKNKGHGNKTRGNGPRDPKNYPGPRQETVTCREVAIYEGPIDDEAIKRPNKRYNRRDYKRDNSRSNAKEKRESQQQQRRPAGAGRYGTRNPRAYFYDVTDNEESEEEYDDEDGEYEYIRNRPRRHEDDEVPSGFIEAALMSIMMERMMVNEMMNRRGGRNSSSSSSTNSFMNRLASMFSR
ncbi:hypothetical protein QAD02_012123 [Eretmocerus hayati]|uniref:Uncharacterized protein n=1 Tax=Eretmocerus hayati TaxID=131215 RepID=A0ACC2NZT0_9HYME|nr:hypothetical protein QAD02_012123 [Eretmocerus hayati]